MVAGTGVEAVGIDVAGVGDGEADASPPPMVDSTSPQRMTARDVTVSQGTLGRRMRLPGRIAVEPSTARTPNSR